MTIDEAIIHAREVADDECDECKREHAQLAEWLEELKERRENAEKCKWHDLQKNPDDLPTREDKQYLYLEVERYGDFIFRNYRVDNCHYDKCLTVAWKEIEPFEEVES